MKKIFYALIFTFLSSNAFAFPSIDGNVVTFPDDGNQWKVYDRDAAINVCRSWVDGLECVVPVDGEYFIINVTTNMRTRVDILAAGGGGMGPTTDSANCPSLARHFIDQVSYLGRVPGDSFEDESSCISFYGNAENGGVVNISLENGEGTANLNAYDMLVLRSLFLSDGDGTSEKNEYLLLSPEEANACAAYSGCGSNAASLTPANPDPIFPGATIISDGS